MPVATVLLNGVAADRISCSDRGLQYGDGLFETVAVVDGRPALWGRHLDRLQLGCVRLGIPPPDPLRLRDEVEREIAGRDRLVIKIILTRGEAGRGYRPPASPQPNRLVSSAPWPDQPRSWRTAGVRLRYCNTPLGINPALAGVKHLNRLEQVLARGEWSDPEIAEGLMLDGAGRVIEGTQSNLFLWRDGGLHTPDLSAAGVSGVMRGLVLELARSLGIEVGIGHLFPEDLAGADGLFMTNALIGYWPVCELEGLRFDISRLPRELLARIETECFRG